jgi:hypothetical protein
MRDFPDGPPLEALNACAGIAEAEWLAGGTGAGCARCAEILSRLGDRCDRIDEAAARHRVLRFCRSSPDRCGGIRRIAAPLIELPGKGLLPKTALYRGLVQALLATIEGRPQDGRDPLLRALETSRRLGMAEVTWRIHVELAALEPAGSAARAAARDAAAAIVRAQASAIRDDEIRGAYLAQRERRELLADGPRGAGTPV